MFKFTSTNVSLDYMYYVPPCPIETRLKHVRKINNLRLIRAHMSH